MGKCDRCKKKSEKYDCAECKPDYKITNADKIRSMDDKELAEFINFGVPDCSDHCPDFKAGCSFGCKHNNGKDFLIKWLQSEAE